jgi:hypothetical protein
MEHGAAACLGKPITLENLCCSLNEVSKRSLTSDRWGGLIPSAANKKLNVKACFSGIAAKLSPTVSSGGRSVSVEVDPKAALKLLKRAI